MKLKTPEPTGEERFFGDDEIIVSKTDTKGRLTYTNQVFLSISGYIESEMLGQPHNVIRHPEMPRGVFKLLWETIQSGAELFAFVKNLCKDGAHYWVLAHVTPTFDGQGQITGYHSSRRVPDREALRQIEEIYEMVNRVEARHPNPKTAAEAGFNELNRILQENGVEYDAFIFSLLNRRLAA